MPDRDELIEEARRRVDAATRVLRGARLLDRRARGWAHRVTRPVCVASTRDCPVGQTFGDYWLGCRRLGLPGVDDQAVAHGFLPLRYDDEVTLEALWEQEVAARRRNPFTRLLARRAA